MQEPEMQQEDVTKEMELFDYLEVIVKRKKLIFWVTVSSLCRFNHYRPYTSQIIPEYSQNSPTTPIGP